MLPRMVRLIGRHKRIEARLSHYASDLQEIEQLLQQSIHSFCSLARLVSRYPEAEFPEQREILPRFKVIAHHPSLKMIIQTFPDLMWIERKYAAEYYLPHAELINCAFYHAVRALRQEDVMKMARLIIHRDHVLHETAVLQRAASSDFLSQGLMVLAEKCPYDSKYPFYTALDKAGFLAEIASLADLYFEEKQQQQANDPGSLDFTDERASTPTRSKAKDY